MSKLVIIGNGFDIHYGLKTSYTYFEEYLKNNRKDIWQSMKNFSYISFNDNGENWNNIEQKLCFDFVEYAYDLISNYGYDLNDENVHWNDFNIQVSIDLDWIPKMTNEAFCCWIKSIELDDFKLQNDLPFNLDNESYYLSFNYTLPLEKCLNVSADRIFHIHGQVDNQDNPIQFGYYSELDSPDMVLNEIQKSIIDKDEFGGWMYMEGAKDFKTYISSCFKNVKGNIPKLESFLSNKEIDEVVVLGHSLSITDEKYFKEVLVPKFINVKWNFFYYKDEEKNSKIEFIKKNNITNYKLSKW